MKKWWLIAYDIREPKRLRKVAKLLEGYGRRLQYSLFRVRVTNRDLQKIRWEMSKRIEANDSILYIGLSERDIETIQKTNAKTNWPDAEVFFQIL